MEMENLSMMKREFRLAPWWIQIWMRTAKTVLCSQHVAKNATVFLIFIDVFTENGSRRRINWLAEFPLHVYFRPFPNTM